MVESINMKTDEFLQLDLIEEAMIHPSYVKENGVTSNQELKLVGGNYLSFIIVKWLNVNKVRNPELITAIKNHLVG